MKTFPSGAIVLAGLVFGCGGFLETGGELDAEVIDAAPDEGFDGGVDAHEDVAGDVPIEVAPDPSEDAPVEVVEDAPCVTIGCPASGPAVCCEGLGEVNDCLPGLPCPEELTWCINCGDSSCSPHETAFNCFVDCPGGCEVGSSLSYGCGPGGTYQCTCIEDPCIPLCDMMRGPAWIDPCTDTPIPGTGDPACFPFGEIHCLHIGTADEGWYDTQWEGEHVVRLGGCQNRWDCQAAD